MCGRHALAAPRSQLASRFALDHCDDHPLRYNIAPGSDIAAVRLSPTGQRVLHLLRWGLLPHWASERAIGARLINARAESLRARPSFRQSFQRRRCLMPASGFDEWQAAPADAVDALLRPYPAAELRAWPLTRRVGRASAERPDRIADCRGGDGDDPQ